MRRITGARFLLVVVGMLATLLALPQITRASDHLPSDAPESWAMFYFTSVTLLSGFGTPHSRAPGSVELALELDSIPHLSKEQRTVGFGGTKEENLNNAPLFARPRVTVGLPWKLALSLSYVPPVEVFGVQPELFAAALERPLYEKGPWTVGVRTYGQTGYVKGPFTCPGPAAKSPPGSPDNPYGCEQKSNDTALQRYVGLELSGSFRMDVLRGLTPYLTLGANYLDTKFRVHAHTFGFLDQTHLSSDTWTFSLGAGATYPLTERIHLTVGVFYSPLWVTRPPQTSEERDSLVNMRTELSYSFR